MSVRSSPAWQRAFLRAYAEEQLASAPFTQAIFNLLESPSMMRVTREVKATLKAHTGRVVSFTKDSEPGVISLAVPDDRAQLSPTEARALAAWLNDAATEIERAAKGDADRALRTGPRPGPRGNWLSDEALIRRGMGTGGR
ncbi:hypothetical protein ACFWIP_24850 [Streptomyces anulatus]|uniref:hypothetical protein n=1 Tax=Streptomyces anulatus TaxID=1892 RepID=UPI00364F58A8